MDRIQLRLCGQSGEIPFPGPFRQGKKQRSDTDTIEFVQIGGGNTQKLCALQNRKLLILCLLQYSLVEFQPGKLSVFEIRRFVKLILFQHFLPPCAKISLHILISSQYLQPFRLVQKTFHGTQNAVIVQSALQLDKESVFPIAISLRPRLNIGHI